MESAGRFCLEDACSTADTGQQPPNVTVTVRPRMPQSSETPESSESKSLLSDSFFSSESREPSIFSKSTSNSQESMSSESSEPTSIAPPIYDPTNTTVTNINNTVNTDNTTVTDNTTITALDRWAIFPIPRSALFRAMTSGGINARWNR